MTWRWGLVGLVACGSAPPRAHDAFQPDATPAAFEALLRGSVFVHEIAFDDPRCHGFSATRELRADSFHELAGCLASLHLTIDPS